MSELAIRARDLRKVYRLYRKPQYRILDMFGLLPARDGRYTEHAALDGVSLDIGRGEKVAVIGRNGAGKSTFLKLVTNVIMPTSGSLEVTGKVHALLQIGTGFHPDFTGRENVNAYLAQLGVTGREAARRCAEIVEFAELEAYIDQPVKTYSTGMSVRLMFSTSTAVTPDLLVLDEVLGVGDAYFAHKSYERIRQLCDREGTTLLLVTHDIYSAVNICSRVIWIDRGAVLMDGDGAEVVKAYEDSIRQQEESRLRVKQMERMREAAAERPETARSMLVEIKPPSGRPAPSPVHFARIAIEAGGREAAALPLGADGFDPLPSRLQDEGTAWGEPGEWQGRSGRPLKNYGSAFHKAAGVLAFDPQSAPDATLVVDYWSEVSPDLMVEVFHEGRSAVLGRLDGTQSEWNRAELPLAGATWTAGEAGLGINVTGITGSGALRVRAVRPVDGAGQTTHSLRHDEPAGIEIDYALVDPAFRERPHIVVAWQRDGVADVCRFISRDVLLDAAERTSGTIRLRIPRMSLVDGTYAVTILIAKEGYYDRTQTLFYTLNPDVYYVASRVFEVVVRGSGLIGAGTVVIGSGEWDAV